ncbi:MAG: adenosylmethionine decarboxylase [Pseudopedobacter saltans]|uniref:Adenosylmethionine decarboxylase n=1 Tax=Pseudopedobacter saltans TaxID=151895 RepID=A0A2W5F5K0_9SPHI|nr:MAG: adenosylmethionine decarboxylase [Pseudopedobacter saltans]
MEVERRFGLHKLLTLTTENKTRLLNLDAFVRFTEQIISKYDMEQVGISTHIFETGGYTAAICLKESHICVHTWPEINSLTLDVYLCNYQRNNEQNVRDIGQEFVVFFEGKIINENEINR